NDTSAYKPKKEIYEHPRYLEVLTNIIDIFRVLFLRNLCFPMFAYKYLPNLLENFIETPNEPLESFYSIKHSDNPLKEVIERNIRTIYSCVDICSLYVKILYKELFNEEIFQNRKRILINDFIKEDSHLYKAYEDQPKLVVKTTETTILLGGLFSATLVASIIFLIFLIKFLPIAIHKVFSHTHPKIFQ